MKIVTITNEMVSKKAFEIYNNNDYIFTIAEGGVVGDSTINAYKTSTNKENFIECMNTINDINEFLIDTWACNLPEDKVIYVKKDKYQPLARNTGYIYLTSEFINNKCNAINFFGEELQVEKINHDEYIANLI
jgi:hypothetical protein